jgi:hypothetical protein
LHNVRQGTSHGAAVAIAALHGDMSMIVQGTLAPFGAIIVELGKAVAFELAAEKRADARVRETKWMFVNRLKNRMKLSANHSDGRRIDFPALGRLLAARRSFPWREERRFMVRLQVS